MSEIRHPLPWHRQAWKQLQNAHKAGRFPHALLLVGQKGMGKRYFSQHLSQLLLCDNPDWDLLLSCETCPACQKTANNAHPDYKLLGPQEGKKVISIDDVRNILNYLQLSNQSSKGNKVVVIDPADAMNHNSANAILKSLEEPPQKRIIILIAEELGKIPPTIRSRCQLLRFSAVADSALRKWLDEMSKGRYEPANQQLEGLSPLDILDRLENTEIDNNKIIEQLRKQWLSVTQLSQSALTVAQIWSEMEDQDLIKDWLQRELAIALRYISGVPVTMSGKETESIYILAGLDAENLLYLQNKINRVAELLESNANNKILWETLLIDCHKLTTLANVT